MQMFVHLHKPRVKDLLHKCFKRVADLIVQPQLLKMMLVIIKIVNITSMYIFTLETLAFQLIITFSPQLVPLNQYSQHSTFDLLPDIDYCLAFQIWCGPKNCISHQNTTEPLEVCGPQQSCVVQTEHNCFVSPCLPWGQCKDIDKINDPLPHSINTNCVPNVAELGSNCAKITLIFELKKMPVVGEIS